MVRLCGYWYKLRKFHFARRAAAYFVTYRSMTIWLDVTHQVAVLQPEEVIETFVLVDCVVVGNDALSILGCLCFTFD